MPALVRRAFACPLASLALALTCGCAAPQVAQPVTVRPISLSQPSLAPPQALAPALPQPSQPLHEGLPPRGPGEELPRSTPDGLTLNDLEQMALGSNPSLARA